jgi:tetraacyldisaccharide 4'-kinase
LTKHYGAFEHLKYHDHHAYSDSDVLKIEQQAGEKIILTTEKDFSKLAQKLPSDRLWCLKIELDFVFEEERRQFERILSDI